MSGSLWDAWLAGPDPEDCQECFARPGEKHTRECDFNRGLPVREGSGS